MPNTTLKSKLSETLPKILPKPTKSLWQLLGPSIVFVALSLNGGEMLLWPNLVSQHGLKIIWPIPIILILQYAVNMEIERYTAVTGKNTLGGMIELNKFIAFLFPIGILISLVWPAWGSSAGNVLAYLLGLPQYGAGFGVAVMLVLTLIWNSKNSYKILEIISKIGLSLVFTIVLGVVIWNFKPEIWSELFNGFKNFGYVPANIDKFGFVSALAFGGVAGVLNLVQSDWVASKKYAAGQIDNPSDIDWENGKTKSTWKSWWNLLKKEHFILFFIGNMVGITLLSVLGFLLLTGTGVSGFKLLTTEIDILNRTFYGLGSVFGIAVFTLFFMAQMTILDAQGRLLKQCLPNKYFAKFSSNQISQIVAGIGILILLISTLNSNFNQPIILLQISATLSAAIMAIYPPILLYLNSKLPKETQGSIFSKVLVITCSIFYGIIFAWSFT